jgi:peptidoglycan/LPS O-acetylase OafA/YrhL
MGAREDRLPSVDLVRLVSIAVVFAVHLHAAGITRLPEPAVLRDAWLQFARNGSYGVSLFFVVSGFVITRTILSRDRDLARLDLRAFYVRRAGRILPLFILAVGLGIVALVLVEPGSSRTAFCLRDPRARFDPLFWLSLSTFSFNWLRIARESVSYGFGLHWDVLWSLAIEEQFYLGYPLALRTLVRRDRVTWWLLGVVLLGPLWRAACAALVPGSFLLAFTASFAAFDLIALGALLCLVIEKRPAPASGGLGRVEAFLGALGLAGLCATFRFSSLDRPFDRVWGPSALGLSLVLFLAVAIRRSWFGGRFFATLSAPGQFSYGGYLFHATTLFLLWPVLTGRDAIAAYALYAAVTLLLAGVAYRFYEAKANRAVRRALRAA